MGFHTFDATDADRLEEAGQRYRYLSREELLSYVRPDESAVLADLGSGTGFFTDDVAPHVSRLYAVDVQEAMHDYYRQKGVPSNVDLVTADAESLPFGDDVLDGAFSTMTFHEIASQAAISELARVLRPGGRVVIVDWSKDGAGEAGPPLSERFTAAEADDRLSEAEFEVEARISRPETFVITAARDDADEA